VPGLLPTPGLPTPETPGPAALLAVLLSDAGDGAGEAHPWDAAKAAEEELTRVSGRVTVEACRYCPPLKAADRAAWVRGPGPVEIGDTRGAAVLEPNQSPGARTCGGGVVEEVGAT
jgi:hypothetical protein